jgi:hypothetical protein
MVKDKKVDVIARDYTINLHKALNGMYVCDAPHNTVCPLRLVRAARQLRETTAEHTGG